VYASDQGGCVENGRIASPRWDIMDIAARPGPLATTPTCGGAWGATIVNQIDRVCLRQHPLPAAAHFCPQCGAPAAAGSPTATAAYPGAQPTYAPAPAPGYGPPPGYAPSPYSPPLMGAYTQPTNTLSNVAIGLAVVALLILPILFGPAAIICAGVALSRKERKAGLAMGLAIGGMLVGFLFGAMVYATL
jgi:hypothetical protein